MPPHVTYTKGTRRPRNAPPNTSDTTSSCSRAFRLTCRPVHHIWTGLHWQVSASKRTHLLAKKPQGQRNVKHQQGQCHQCGRTSSSSVSGRRSSNPAGLPSLVHLQGTADTPQTHGTEKLALCDSSNTSLLPG